MWRCGCYLLLRVPTKIREGEILYHLLLRVPTKIRVNFEIIIYSGNDKINNRQTLIYSGSLSSYRGIKKRMPFGDILCILKKWNSLFKRSAQNIQQFVGNGLLT